MKQQPISVSGGSRLWRKQTLAAQSRPVMMQHVPPPAAVLFNSASFIVACDWRGGEQAVFFACAAPARDAQTSWTWNTRAGPPTGRCICLGRSAGSVLSGRAVADLNPVFLLPLPSAPVLLPTPPVMEVHADLPTQEAEPHNP